MSKKKRKSGDHDKLDVSQIVKGIKENAKERSLQSDLKRLNDLDIRDLSVDGFTVTKLADMEKEESLDDNLYYVNTHYSLFDKIRQVPSRRKGPLGRMANFVMRRIVFVVSESLKRLIQTQEEFNTRTVRIFNSLEKIVRPEVEHLERFEEEMRECQKQVKDDMDNLHKKIEEKSGELESQVEENIQEHIEQMKETQEEQMNQLRESVKYPELDIDYKKFEDTFRGPQEDIKERAQQFLKFFHECKEVLDVGCGRGEFIEALHAYGSGAYGVDIDPSMVEECKSKGLNVLEQDVLSHLKSLPDNHLDGIFGDQLIEHLTKPDILELIKLSYQKVKKGKYVVFTTPNIKTMAVFANAFYADLTHVTPLNPQTLEFLFESAGFSKVELFFYSEVSEDQRLTKPEGDDVMAENIDKLNLFLFGPQDYAVIGQK